MPKAHIRLAWRQLIDAASTTPFEQQVFHSTWAEFKYQQQSFAKGQDLPTWAAIRETFPKSNPILPHKVSFSIAGILNKLDNKIPGLQDSLGKQEIPFVQYRFELISSDMNDPMAHKVGIIYLTDVFTLFEIIGDQLLLAFDPPHTFLLKMQPGLSIFSYIEPVSHVEPPSHIEPAARTGLNGAFSTCSAPPNPVSPSP
jgi:hypothetical protein